MQMSDFRELTLYKGGKKERIKNANQDKGFVNEFEAFKKGLADFTVAKEREKSIKKIKEDVEEVIEQEPPKMGLMAMAGE